MVETISLDEIEKHAENVYEAIVMIAKRARQINDEQKRVMEMELSADEEVEDSFDEEQPSEPVEQSYVRLPKPTRIALQEMLAGKLKAEYDNEEEKGGAEPEKSASEGS
jgi:DNA-directed RNA polymerase omega subunit